MKIKKLTVLFCTITLISCSKHKITLGEIEATYNKKNDSYTITYPEYNKVYPKAIKIGFKKPKSINEGIVLSYNIETDNVPLLLNINVIEENDKKKYTVEYPLVNRDISITLFDTNFIPPLNNSKKIKDIEVSIESEGDVDTKDTVIISLKEMKSYLKKEQKSKKNIDNKALLILPESGHFAKSNPPFIMFTKASPITRVYLSRDITFETSYVYDIKEYNFFSMTNTLQNGKWYAAFDENADTNLRSVFHFFIGDRSTKITPITNKPLTNERPFIYADKTSIDVLGYFYNARRLNGNIFTRNLAAFKLYAEEHIGKWSKDGIMYRGEVRNTENVYFDSLPSHTTIMALYSYYNTNNIDARNEIKNILKDIVAIDETKTENYNVLDSTVILANSLMMPFDLLYNTFSAEELISMKQAFIKYGTTLYKYITENPEIYRKKDAIKYATTLGLISLNMINENIKENDIRKWYYFSINYINAMILSMFENDGSFKIAVSEAFDVLFPIMKYAVTLKNAGIFDAFQLESFKNIGKFLSSVGYPSGYTLPVGYCLIDYRSKMRFDNGSRNAVMELLSKTYMSALYKNYANYGLSESLNVNYLPFMLIWNNYSIYDNAIIRNTQEYQSSYFKNIEASIYNENILNISNAYLAIYAKGYNVDDSFKLNHNDRMSFIYYNYGDSIIDEAGFSGQTNLTFYDNIANAKYHNTISIDGEEMIESIGSFSHIKSMTNNARFFYAHSKSERKYIYPNMLKDFERRFYYLKPNILIVKENIESLPDITKTFHGYGNLYSWRFTTKLPLTFNNLENTFIIEGEKSRTYIKLITDAKLGYSVTSTNMGNTIYTGEATALEKLRKFNPWIIISTVPKNNVRIDIRKRALNSNIEIKSFSETNIIFNILNKTYNINAFDENIRNALYTENRENVIINSD